MARNINITGGEALAQALRELPTKIERNIMRSAMRKGARVIATEAKANVPVQDGDLRRSIRVTTQSQKGEVTATAVAGNKRAFYANWVEFGTIGHMINAKPGKLLKFTARDGKVIETPRVLHPGARPRPFMRPALDAKADEAVRAVANQVRSKLNERGINTPDGGGGD